jgi:hypothetical protein
MLIRAGEQSWNLRGANPVPAHGGYCVGHGSRDVLDRHDNSGDDFPLCAPLDVQRKAHVAVENLDQSDIACEAIQHRARLDHLNGHHNATPTLRPRAKPDYRSLGLHRGNRLVSYRFSQEQILIGRQSYSRPNHVSERLTATPSRRDPRTHTVRQLSADKAEFLFELAAPTSRLTTRRRLRGQEKTATNSEFVRERTDEAMAREALAVRWEGSPDFTTSPKSQAGMGSERSSLSHEANSVSADSETPIRGARASGSSDERLDRVAICVPQGSFSLPVNPANPRNISLIRLSPGDRTERFSRHFNEVQDDKNNHAYERTGYEANSEIHPAHRSALTNHPERIGRRYARHLQTRLPVTAGRS